MPGARAPLCPPLNATGIKKNNNNKQNNNNKKKHYFVMVWRENCRVSRCRMLTNVLYLEVVFRDDHQGTDWYSKCSLFWTVFITKSFYSGKFLFRLIRGGIICSTRKSIKVFSIEQFWSQIIIIPIVLFIFYLFIYLFILFWKVLWRDRHSERQQFQRVIIPKFRILKYDFSE